MRLCGFLLTIVAFVVLVRVLDKVNFLTYSRTSCAKQDRVFGFISRLADDGVISLGGRRFGWLVYRWRFSSLFQVSGTYCAKQDRAFGFISRMAWIY